MLLVTVALHAGACHRVAEGVKDRRGAFASGVAGGDALPCYIASMFLFATSLFVEHVHFASFTTHSILAVVYLGVIASVGGIVAYFKLGQVSTPFTASICFLIFPLIALGLSDIVTHQTMSRESLLMLLPLFSGILVTKLPFDKLLQKLNLRSTKHEGQIG